MKERLIEMSNVENTLQRSIDTDKKKLNELKQEIATKKLLLREARKSQKEKLPFFRSHLGQAIDSFVSITTSPLAKLHNTVENRRTSPHKYYAELLKERYNDLEIKFNGIEKEKHARKITKKYIQLQRDIEKILRYLDPELNTYMETLRNSCRKRIEGLRIQLETIDPETGKILNKIKVKLKDIDLGDGSLLGLPKIGEENG
jgi:hypothetical protein